MDRRRLGVAGLGLAGSAALGLGAAHHWGRWIDDAYITFRYSLNLLQGRGMVFNPGERLEGITNLGWALMMTPWADDDPLGVARVFGLAATFATLVVLLRWGASRSLPALGAAVAVLVLPAWVPFAAVQGLETPAVMLLVTLGWARYARELAGGGAPLAGPAMGLAPAMRPDAALLPALVGLWHLVRGPTWSRRVAVSVGAVLLGAAGLVGLKMWWFGAILPNTFHVKTGPWPFLGGAQYVATFLQDPSPAFGVVVVLAVLVALGFAARRDDRALPGLVFAAWLTMSWAVNGDFFSNFRLLVPAWPALAAAVAVAVDALGRRMGPLGPGMLTLGVVLALMPHLQVAELSHAVDRSAFPRSSARTVPYPAPLLTPWTSPMWNQGLRDQWTFNSAWVLTHTDPRDAVAITDIGLVSYLNDNPVVDLLGLTDAVMAGRSGEDEGAQWAYLRERADHIILDTQLPIFRRYHDALRAEGWGLEASCGPLWVFRNPTREALPAPPLEDVLPRAHRALRRAPGMVGLHVALAWNLRARGLDDARLMAFIDEAEAVAAPRTRVNVDILRCELGLTDTCEARPPMCSRGSPREPVAEVAARGDWPHVFGQTIQAAGPGGCDARMAQARHLWAALEQRWQTGGERALAAQARELLAAPADRPRAMVNRARALAEAAGEAPGVAEALAASEEAWGWCRGG
ncbi:MAG: hypothetical protein H6739_24510 [Alphaproteobacteria bacterium]|nr:hypothetical protein [Alphaproteobacteria bacterium]